MSVNRPRFEHVAAASRDRLCRRARWHGFPPHEAEDLVQETLKTGYEKWPAFEWRSQPETWLCGILDNKVYNHRRKKSCERRNLDSYGTTQCRHDPHDHHPVVTRHQLDAGLESLGEDCRETFVRCALEGYTAREIAEASGVNIHTITSRVHTARAMLRRRLNRAFLPWIPHHWGLSVVGGFCKGVLGSVTMALMLVVIRPQDVRHDDAAIEPRNHPRHVLSKPSPAVSKPELPDAEVDAVSEKSHLVLVSKPNANSPPPEPSVIRKDDYEAKHIQDRYYAGALKAAGAKRCAVALFDDSRSIGPSATPSTLGPWMDHVPNIGTLLDSACEKMPKLK